jgi:hypothetical protein
MEFIKYKNKDNKILREGLKPHMNKKEHYINPYVLAGLGGGFIVTRNQDDLEGKQEYYNANNLVDKIFD